MLDGTRKDKKWLTIQNHMVGNSNHNRMHVHIEHTTKMGVESPLKRE